MHTTYMKAEVILFNTWSFNSNMNVVIVPTSSWKKHVASQPVYEAINSCKKSVSV